VVYLLCEDCGRVETEPFDVGDKCVCGGHFIEVDQDTAAAINAAHNKDEDNSKLDPD